MDKLPTYPPTIPLVTMTSHQPPLTMNVHEMSKIPLICHIQLHAHTRPAKTSQSGQLRGKQISKLGENNSNGSTAENSSKALNSLESVRQHEQILKYAISSLPLIISPSIIETNQHDSTRPDSTRPSVELDL